METEIISIDTSASWKNLLTRPVDTLREGGVIALPAETVYGLAADVKQEQALEKIFTVKGRPKTDPLIVHLANRAQLEEVALIPDDVAEGVELLVKRFWPGPLTLILPKHPDLSELITAGLPTVAVRMPEAPIFRGVLKALGSPLAAPSANRFASISPTTARAVEQELGGEIPFILDGGACSYGIESTIVEVFAPEKEGGKFIAEILRPGPLTREDLRVVVKVKQRFAAKKLAEAAQAPGQFARHYAPQTPLELLDCAQDWQPREAERVGLLCLADDAPWQERGTIERVEMLSPGAAKLPEAMVRFYHCLRSLDEAGLDRILVEKLPDRGLGVSLNERLKRAASTQE